jgi:hypothetical protein
MSEDGETRLEALLRERALRHRLEGAAPLRSLSDIEQFLAERRIAFVSGRGSLPSLAEAIAGLPLHGSWWSDPSGERIYDLLSAAEAEGLLGAPFLSALLVSGKQTVIAPPLAGAVDRLARARERTRRATGGLSAKAAELLRIVRETGGVRMDAPRFSGPQGRRARIELERALLVTSCSVHTERGRHVALVQPWASSPLARQAAAAPDAHDREPLLTLVDALLHSSVVVAAEETKGWLPAGVQREELEAALERAEAERFSARGRTWITPSRPRP